MFALTESRRKRKAEKKMKRAKGMRARLNSIEAQYKAERRKSMTKKK